MTNTEIHRIYNDWRRDRTGDRTLEDFGITPKMVGEAIDAVLKDAERYQFVRSGRSRGDIDACIAICDWSRMTKDVVSDEHADELVDTAIRMANER